MGLRDSNLAGQLVKTLPSTFDGHQFAQLYSDRCQARTSESPQAENKIRDYFYSVEDGPGVWKWAHYFDVYNRHLSKFVNIDSVLVEIGVYSGGSLPMWRAYLGSACHIHGVDIQDACRTYQNEFTTIHVGDQADRAFWRGFREAVTSIDILIDDGGHTPEQQRVTLEETLPYLNLGGVFICEDIHYRNNDFTAYLCGLVDQLNHMQPAPGPGYESPASPWQAHIHSIHFYPYIAVIEKHAVPCARLAAPKRGTQWQPFLDLPNTPPAPR